MSKSFKYLNSLGIFFVSIFIISNIASVKILELGWFIFDGGTLLFPFTYILGDILTEVYGYKKTRNVIWLGFFMAIVMSLVFVLIGNLPSAIGWENQHAYDAILGSTFRIVLASLVAYFFGEFLNSYILAKMKIWTKGKKLWVRAIGSTLVAELIDTVLFITLAFYGILPDSLLLTIMISNYLFKLGIEILFIPLTYKVVRFLKKEEEEDYYDTDTNFNPFVRY